jgi:hypothetical protein
MANIPINIPTFISSVDYKPAVVNPRIFFYNGKRDSQPWYFRDGTNTSNPQTSFPYFDHYQAGSGSGDFPTSNSRSLLFLNENPPYGSIPNESLYSLYWDEYVSLLYNPRTRLINATGIIPLAVYFDTNLNDIIEWKGNFYHLRAINNYDLKTGECEIQLLGPILPDSINNNL